MNRRVTYVRPAESWGRTAAAVTAVVVGAVILLILVSLMCWVTP